MSLLKLLPLLPVLVVVLAAATGRLRALGALLLHCHAVLLNDKSHARWLAGLLSGILPPVVWTLSFKMARRLPDEWRPTVSAAGEAERYGRCRCRCCEPVCKVEAPGLPSLADQDAPRQRQADFDAGTAALGAPHGGCALARRHTRFVTVLSCNRRLGHRAERPSALRKENCRRLPTARERETQQG
jgi:hypothetical protein